MLTLGADGGCFNPGFSRMVSCLANPTSSTRIRAASHNLTVKSGAPASKAKVTPIRKTMGLRHFFLTAVVGTLTKVKLKR